MWVGFSTVRVTELWMPPRCPVIWERHKGPLIKEGMAFCIEPMITAGNPEIILARDKQTYKIKDGSWAAHCEHTLAIVNGVARVLTQAPEIADDVD